MSRQVGNSLIKRLGFYGLIGAYLVGGINHFISPEWYWPLIPPYLVFIKALNLISGLLEVVFALGLIFNRTRKWSVYGIIGLLIAFLPAHIHFIQLGSCISNVMCFEPWVAWVRFLVVHPILIYWAFIYRNYKRA
jgi:uncharacterized membrane protein